MPLVPDVINSPAFYMAEMIDAINGLDFFPGRLGELGLFQEAGISTATVLIERRDGQLNLVPTSPRGAPGDTRPRESRNVRAFQVPHVQRNDRLMADSLLGVRAYNGSQLEAVTARRDELLAIHRADLEATIEWHRVGALKGQILDSDGAVIYNLFDEFGVTQTTIGMGLDVATTEVRAKTFTVKKAMEAALGGLRNIGARAFAGDDFWSALITHKSIKETYLNTLQAASLRGNTSDELVFDGIIWERYRGRNGATPYIPATEAYVVPTNVPGMLMTRYAPADWIEMVNTLGIPLYAKAVADPMGKGIDIEAQTNPLSINARPEAVIRLTLA